MSSIDNDCGPDCGCHKDPREGLEEVGNDVWKSPNGGSSGPSEKMRKLLARKKAREATKNDNIGDFKITF